MNLYRILKNNSRSFIFKLASAIGILIGISIIPIMIFSSIGMWSESLNTHPNKENVTILENKPQSALTSRKLREWEQSQLINKYWESINNLNAHQAISLLTEEYKIIKEAEIEEIVLNLNEEKKFKISDLTEAFMICPKIWAATFYINKDENEKNIMQIQLKNVSGTWQISYIGEPNKC